MATTNINKLTFGKNPTANDVLFIAASVGYEDAGRLIMGYDWVNEGDERSASNDYALKMTGKNVRLVVGGNFEHNETQKETRNYKSFASIERPSVWHTSNKALDANYNIHYYAQNAYNTVTGAVKFTGDTATLSLSSHTGAKSSNIYNQHKTSPDSYKKDDYIRIKATSETLIKQDWNKTSDTTVVHTFDADNTLVVNTDLAGKFDAVAIGYRDGYKPMVGDKPTPTNNSDNQRIEAVVFQAADLELQRNMRGIVTAKNWKSDSDFELGDATGTVIKAYATPSHVNNTVYAFGFSIDNNLTLNEGRWSGNTTAEVKNSQLTQEYDDLYEDITGITVPGAPGKRKSASSTFSGNLLKAVGLKVGEYIYIDVFDSVLNDSEVWVKPEINAVATNNKFHAYAKSETADSSVSLTFINNEISATAIETKKLVLGQVADTAKFNVTVSNNKMIASYDIGKPSSSSNNVIAAYGFKADTVTFNGAFDGNITIVANNNLFNLDLINQSSEYLFYGIYAANDISANYNLGGHIDVKGYSTALSTTECGISAVKSPNITVKGCFDTDIVMNYVGVAGGGNSAIDTSNLTADAFTGSITGNIENGIFVNNRVKTKIDGDAFDMAGVISLNSLGQNGMLFWQNALNLRVSGTIITNQGKAIKTESNGSSLNDRPYDDNVDIAHSAVLVGDIDLSKGTNIVTINSNARVNGNLLSYNGRMNIRFMLDGEFDDTAVAETGGSIVYNGDSRDDVSLTSASTLTVNLNYAKNGETYRLFKYEGDFSEYWSDRFITFVYRGETVTQRIGEDVVFAQGVTAKVEYDKGSNSLVVKEINGVEEHTPFDVSTVSEVYNKEAHTLELKWDPVDYRSYGLVQCAAIELEYQVFDKDGNAYGKSIVARLGGNATGYTIDGIKPAINDDETGNAAGDTVRWRMRLDGDDGSNVSGWSAGNNFNDWEEYVAGAEDVTHKIRVDNAGSLVKNVENENEGITSSIAVFSWFHKADNADAQIPGLDGDQLIRNYDVEYFEVREQIEANPGEDLDKKIRRSFEDLALRDNAVVYKKTVSSPEAVVSGLTNQTYVYWRVRGTDIYGIKSDNWLLGDTLRVWVGDDKNKPVFDKTENSVEWSFDFNDDSKTHNINAKFQWNGASDSESGIKYYWIEYSPNADFSNALVETIRSGTGEKYTEDGKEYERYTHNIKGLSSPEYYYRISAWDYFNNQTYLLTNGHFGDYYAPEFKTENDAQVNIDYDRTDPYNVKINATFSWKQASDKSLLEEDKDASGIDYYLLEYKRIDQTWEQAETVIKKEDEILSHTTQLDAGQYNYRVSAFDNMGRQSGYVFTHDGASEEFGVFGSTDITPPKGGFTKFNPADVEVEWGEIIVVEETEEDGTSGGNGDESGEVDVSVYSTQLGATVTLSWEDTYSDESGVFYKVDFSDSESFNTKRTYSYITHVANQKEFVLGNFLPCENVGILEGMKNVYWRVTAMDSAGNTTGMPSATQSFKFVDKNSGNEIVTQGDPAAAYQMSVNLTVKDECQTGDLELVWHVECTDLGIHEVKYVFSGKSGNFTINLDAIPPENPETYTEAEFVRVRSTRNLPSRGIADGEYLISVVSVDSQGNSVKSSNSASANAKEPKAVKFTLDTVRPDKILSDALTVDIYGSDIVLKWLPSKDDFGIDRYDVKIRQTGDGNKWNLAKSVNAKETSVVLNGYGNSSYEVIVVAYDKNGNASISSADYGNYKKSFTVNHTNDLPDNPDYAQHYTLIADDAGRLENSIGMSDIADYFYIGYTETFAVSLDVDKLDLSFGKDKGITIAISYFDATGKERQVKKANLKTVKNAFSNLILNSNTGYYFKITSNDMNSCYNYGLYMNVNKLGYSGIDDISYNKNDDDSAYTLDRETYSLSLDGTPQAEWVGYGDTIDYRYVALDQSGWYDFTIINTQAKVKLGVYELKVKNGKQSLTKVKQVTVKAKTSEISTGQLLLDGANTYFVAVETANKKGVGEYYTLSANGYAISNADSSDNVAAFAQTITPSTMVTDWIGAGDTVDWYNLDLSTGGGLYTVKLAATTASSETGTAITVNVYQDNAGKLKKTTSFKLKATDLSNQTKELIFNSGNYYIEVLAPNAAKKNEQTGYNLSVDGQSFSSLGNNTAVTPEVLSVDDTKSGWVGMEYPDYIYSFDVAKGGYNFDFSNIQFPKNIKFSVVDNSTSRVIKSATAKKDQFTMSVALEAGSYRLVVQSADGGKKKYSSYDLNVTSNPVNYRDDSAALVFDNSEYQLSVGSSATGWVGLGDAVSYRQLEITESGYYNLVCRTSTTTNITPKLSMQLVDDSGLVIKKFSKSIDNLLLDRNKNYFIRIEGAKASSGGNVDYELELNVGKELFSGPGVNNSDDIILDTLSLQILDTAVQDWVGFGDLTDFLHFSVGDGNYSLAVSDVSAPVEVELCHKSGDVLTEIMNKTLSGKGASTSFISDPLELASGDYFVKVTATNGEKLKNSSYTLALNTLA